MIAKKRVALVVGAGGFLGAEITRQMLSAGWAVVGTSRQRRRPHSLKVMGGTDENFKLLQFDVCWPIRKLVQKISLVNPDILINCSSYGVNYAEQDIDEAISVNATGAVHLVEAATDAGVQRFIHVGTCAEYGDQGELCREEAALKPKGVYGSTKAAGTSLVLGRVDSGLSLMVVRPFQMYGAQEQDYKLIPTLIRSCLNGRRTDLSGGLQIRDYTYVIDTARMFRMMSELESFNHRYIVNIGTGITYSLKHIGDEISNIVKSRSSVLNWGALDYRPDEIMFLAPNIERLTKLVRSKPSTNLRSGLEKVIGQLCDA